MRFHAEGCSDLIEPVDAQAIFPALERADIGPINSGGIGKRLLRKSHRGPQALQIPGKMFSTGHGPKRTP